MLSRTLRAISLDTCPHVGCSGCGWGRARAEPLGATHGSPVPCSALQLSLEEPVQTAILLSLVGVRSIVANQWPTVLQDNAMRASVLWENLLAVGKSIGRTTHLLQKMGAGEAADRDEPLQTWKDKLALLRPQLQGAERLPIALNMVLYGLPHQAIV